LLYLRWGDKETTNKVPLLVSEMADLVPEPTAAPPVPATVAPDTDAVPGPALEVDTWDADSSLGDMSSIASSTASISSSITKYREENGRRYHAYKDGVYVIPNDDREQDRLDLQHNLFLLTFDGRLYLCPAGKDEAGGKPVRRVLDVGTGTGIWAIDFADDHPDAYVLGVDLSPIQPSFVPPNVKFEVDDLEESWTFADKFDFIYSRMMTAGLANWPRFFEQCFENLSPGGWLEVADITPPTSDDGTLEGTEFDKWAKLLLEGTEMIGRSFNGAVLYKQQMEAAGFVNVTQKIFRWPMNCWPKDAHYKELGMYF